jgi:hypothetical protein
MNVTFVVALDRASIEEFTTSVVNALKMELHRMSQSLEQQVQQATAAIQADIAAVANDITNLGTIATTIQQELASLGTIQPGSTVTVEDVQALLQAQNAADTLKTSTDAAVANLQTIANAATVASTGTVA